MSSGDFSNGRFPVHIPLGLKPGEWPWPMQYPLRFIELTMMEKREDKEALKIRAFKSDGTQYYRPPFSQR